MKRISVDEVAAALRTLLRLPELGYADFVAAMMVVCNAKERVLRKAYNAMTREADELELRKLDEVVTRRDEFRLALAGKLPIAPL
jgi:hypothetical protein